MKKMKTKGYVRSRHYQFKCLPRRLLQQKWRIRSLCWRNSETKLRRDVTKPKEMWIFIFTTLQTNSWQTILYSVNTILCGADVHYFMHHIQWRFMKSIFCKWVQKVRRGCTKRMTKCNEWRVKEFYLTGSLKTKNAFIFIGSIKNP